VRQFGTMDLVKRGKEDKSPPLNKLGIEPLDPSFTLDRFRMTMNKRTTKIKPFLLNQECIVGLGDIYVDEVLFRSGIHPERRVNHLKETELETLHQAIIDTLTEAVSAGGTSVKSYVNGQGEMGMFQQNLKVYGRRDEPCLLCGAIIERFV